MGFLVVVFCQFTADYNEYVHTLPDSARACIDEVLDWDNKSGEGDLKKISHLVTADVEMKLLPELKIPDEDIEKIYADFPNDESLQW